MQEWELEYKGWGYGEWDLPKQAAEEAWTVN